MDCRIRTFHSIPIHNSKKTPDTHLILMRSILSQLFSKYLGQHRKADKDKQAGIVLQHGYSPQTLMSMSLFFFSLFFGHRSFIFLLNLRSINININIIKLMTKSLLDDNILNRDGLFLP